MTHPAHALRRAAADARPGDPPRNPTLYEVLRGTGVMDDASADQPSLPLEADLDDDGACRCGCGYRSFAWKYLGIQYRPRT